MYKIIRQINTVKYLKFIQIVYRLFYNVRMGIWKMTGTKYLLSRQSKSYDLILIPSITSIPSYMENSFTFLNQTYNFYDIIDWNYPKFGKLWTYNLNYFDCLQQNNMDKVLGKTLIYNFIDKVEMIKDGLEAFPISLRGINWIKFLSYHKIKDYKIDDVLLAQYYILMDNLEYHLLGNHLLENGFSLLFGAYYFKDKILYSKAKEILVKEFKEQILDDGAHFELSPMYHQLMLFRVLDCINLIKNNVYNDNELLPLFEEKAQIMLSWIHTMTYKNGNIPLFNDSANGIAPTTQQLNEYAKNLLIIHQPSIINHQLTSSGYRKYVQSNYELIVDVGKIGPDYIPGHAHADTFNFELHVDKKPFIVDTGISTYEKNELRQLERSTVSHNTVTMNDTNQSQVWGGFRVANRAYITQLWESANNIKAIHNGYKKQFNALHKREFVFEEDRIRIIDTINSKREYAAVSRLHFHPNVKIETIRQHIFIQNSKFKIQNYMYAPEFNKQLKAIMIEIPFYNRLELKIIL